MTPEEKAWESIVARLISDQDQDLSHMRHWWKTNSLQAKAIVWERIQRPYSDPAMEIMSRLAQVAFTEMAIKATGRETEFIE